jgi:hypothetical protein
MKNFFREKMTLNEAYINNNEGNDTTLYGSSANITDEQEEKLADMGDQIRDYIQQITQAKENIPPTTKENANKNTDTPSTGNTVMDEMNKRMAKLENMISNMCNNNNNNGNRNGGGKNNSNRNNGNNGNNNNNGNEKETEKFIPYRDRPYTKTRNMGGYCHTHGFHPVGENHTSENCGYKKDNHDNTATWNNRNGGSTLWPKKIREDQKTHESYAGKSAPTN